MIPYLLAAVGGYLMGNSSESKKFADGGEIDSAKEIRKHRNKLVSLNLKKHTPAEHEAISFSIKVIDMLLDGELVISPEIAENYNTK